MGRHHGPGSMRPCVRVRSGGWRYGPPWRRCFLAFGARCREELRGLGTPEEQERALEAQRSALAAQYLADALELSRLRRAAAEELEKKVRSELKLLAMEQTRFAVSFEPESVPADGGDPSTWTERTV